MRRENLVVVITGANRGIGLALVQEYKARDAFVVGICRSSSPTLDALADRVVADIDVSEAASVARLADAIDDLEVDLLINNAGVLYGETLGNIDYATVLKQLEVNAMGPLRVTEQLLPYLNDGAKIALITSRMGSIADNGSGAYYGYRMSKAALNAAGKSLARDLVSRKIAVGILHPGFVQTDMVNHAGDISASVAACRLAERIDGLTLENTGSFWHSNGELLPW